MRLTSKSCLKNDTAMTEQDHDPFRPRDTAAFFGLADRRDSARIEFKIKIRLVKIGTDEVTEFQEYKAVLSLPGIFIEKENAGSLPDESAIVEVIVPTGIDGSTQLVRAPMRPTKRRSGLLVMFDEDDFELSRKVAQYLDTVTKDEPDLP
jgi:hypothetical protein